LLRPICLHGGFEMVCIKLYRKIDRTRDEAEFEDFMMDPVGE
jgi:hypothetical protein